MIPLTTRLDDAAAALRERLGAPPPVVLVTGSGYAFLGDELAGAKGVSYDDLPHFSRCTNPAHPGEVRVGTFHGASLGLLLGRLHGYEGLSPQAVVFNLRAVARWGVQTFILTNAAGGVRLSLRVGDLMAIEDHLNLLGSNPLTGPNEDALGTRFPDMGGVWDAGLRAVASEAAEAAGFTLHSGVYAALPGPVYETPAEVRMLRTLGADAVGMSTVPEAIALRHMGRRIFGLSCITNAAAGTGDGPISDDEVREVLSRPAVQARARAVLKAVTRACQPGA